MDMLSALFGAPVLGLPGLQRKGVVAAVGLLMLIFGGWGLSVLNTAADIDIALVDEAIMLGLAGGGFATIVVAQALPPTCCGKQYERVLAEALTILRTRPPIAP